MALNSVALIGRMTATPEIRKTNNDVSVINFSIAVDRDYKNQDGEYDTDFFNIVAFGSTADFIYRWFDKGNLIGIDGRLIQNKWTDKEGNKRTNTDVIVSSAYFCGSDYEDKEKNKRSKKK